MKSLSSFRFSRVYAVLSVLLLSMATLFSQSSPASIAGKTYDLQISEAGGGFPSSGRFLVLMRGTDWVSYNISVSGLGDQQGTYFYQRSGAKTGQVQFGDFSGMVLSYAGADFGTYSRGLQTGSDYQLGSFRAYSGSAPATLSRKIIRIEPNGGTLNFGEGGTYRILTTSPSVYQVQNASGNVVHSGNYTYMQTNQASGVFRFQDSSHDGGFVVLNFHNGNSGLSLVRKTSSQLFQVGAFTMSNLLAPNFSSQPTSRNVAVGTSTTFSATATGTGPITYQWYKGTNEIPGETGTSFTIPSVQSGDAGNYRVVASNVAGDVSSTTATLVPVCSYSLSSSSLFVDFRGGAQDSITVFASGTCPWTISETNDWITMTSALSGQGNAGISFTVAANESDTPRTGYLQIAGKTLAVAQGARFALPDLAGKTLRLDIFPSEEDERLLIFGSGTNRQMQLVYLNTNRPTQTLEYSYSVTSATEALVSFNNGSVSLDFSPAKGGLFSLKDNLEEVNGTFDMNSSAVDFNGDARGDLVLQSSSGAFAAWHLQNTNFLSVQLLRGGIPANNGGRGFGAADFNRDGHFDLLLQDSTGRIVVWFMQGTNRIGGMTLRNGTPANGWRAFSVADVNSDGHPDVLFQKNADRRLSAWLFNGTTFLGGWSIRNGQPPAVGWRAVSAGDMNHDVQADILLQHDTGKISVWFLNGGRFVSAENLRNGVAPAKWKVMGMADVDENGHTDILWQNENNQVAAWLFQGKVFVRALLLRDGRAAGSGWKVVAPR